MFSNDFLSRLTQQPGWTKEQLVALLELEFPDAAPATLTWRIHDLKSRGLLFAAGRGKYTIRPARPGYAPRPGSGPQRMYGRAAAGLPEGTACCLTDTAWMGEFVGVSLSPTFILIEVEKAYLNAAYDALTDLSRKVFLNPDADDVKRYVSRHDRAVVIRPLVSEAPTTAIKGVVVSSLEKLLVDAVVYADLYAGVQPHLTDLFQKACHQYTLNESRLRRYARRRDRLPEIEPYLT